MRQAGVRRSGPTNDVERKLAHMTVAGPHHRRLADDDEVRAKVVAVSHHLQRLAHSDAADLLVE